MKMQKGFTLIELMIVVAIIAILAAIALPQYQNYVAKSQFTAGIAEISPGKTAVEEKINDGRSADVTVDPVSIGLKTSDRCTVLPSVPTAAGAATIKCTLKGNPKIATKVITLTRDGSDGTWTCSSTLTADEAKKWAPATCQAQT